MKAMTAGDKYISETRHGGKSTRFMFPLTGPGRAEGINMEIAYGLAMKAKWAIDNFSTQDLQTYLATYPSDRQLGVWWIVSNNPDANPLV